MTARQRGPFKILIRFVSRFSVVLFFIAFGQAQAQEVTLRIHCWEGYARPYIEGFKQLIKQQFGYDVKIKITNVSDPDDFWQKARVNDVDLISPAHNIPKSERWPFISGRIAIPLNLNMIPNYHFILPFLQRNDFVTHGENVYGVPYTMGPYGLAYNARKVQEPDSWSVLWTASASNRYTISKDYSDANIYITALVLGATYDKIYDIDMLDSQLTRVNLRNKLASLARNAYSFWEGTANPKEFHQLSYAATWGYAVASANRLGENWRMAKPKEGTTVWVDHWLITKAVKNDPIKMQIAHEWINYTLSKNVQVGVLRNWGVSPVVRNINDLLTPLEIETFNVGDNDYWKTLSLWKAQSIRTQNGYNQLWQDALKSRNYLSQ